MSSLASFQIQRAGTTATSATLDVSMYDPFNYYAVGELWLYETQSGADGSTLKDASAVKEAESNDNLKVQRMSATAEDKQILFTGLTPNRQYSVILGCYDSNGDFVQKDYTTFTTGGMNNWMEVADITWYNVSVTGHIDVADELPTEMWGLIVTMDEDSFDPSQYCNSSKLNDAAAADLSAYINGMTSENGKTMSIAAPNKLIGEDSDDESQKYIGVALIGRYDGSYRVIASKVVKNPYYGMKIKEETNDEDGTTTIKPNTEDTNP